jgi:hypothetical protein
VCQRHNQVSTLLCQLASQLPPLLAEVQKLDVAFFNAGDGQQPLRQERDRT